MNLTKHISKLIANYDYVIIPGFGGFVSNYKPAQIHPVQHVFSPPSKSIAFNKNLTSNDGLLINHVSKEEDIPVTEAKEGIREFVKRCRDQLKQNDVVVMPGIGRIFMDIEDKLQFIQDASQNHLLESYGFPEFKSSPVLRKQLVTTNAVVAKDGDQKQQKISPWWIAIAALFLLMVGLLTWAMVDDGINVQTSELFNTSGNDTPARETNLVAQGTNMMNNVPALDFSTVEITSTTNPVGTPAEYAPRTEIPRTAITNAQIPKGIYVVVGSFMNEANAVELNRQLKNEGFESYRVPAGNGFIRVGVYVSDNLENAYDDLAQLRDKYEVNAWLLQNR